MTMPSKFRFLAISFLLLIPFSNSLATPGDEEALRSMLTDLSQISQRYGQLEDLASSALVMKEELEKISSVANQEGQAFQMGRAVTTSNLQKAISRFNLDLQNFLNENESVKSDDRYHEIQHLLTQFPSENLSAERADFLSDMERSQTVFIEIEKSLSSLISDSQIAIQKQEDEIVNEFKKKFGELGETSSEGTTEIPYTQVLELANKQDKQKNHILHLAEQLAIKNDQVQDFSNQIQDFSKKVSALQEELKTTQENCKNLIKDNQSKANKLLASSEQIDQLEKKLCNALVAQDAIHVTVEGGQKFRTNENRKAGIESVLEILFIYKTEKEFKRCLEEFKSKFEKAERSSGKPWTVGPNISLNLKLVGKKKHRRFGWLIGKVIRKVKGYYINLQIKGTVASGSKTGQIPEDSFLLYIDNQGALKSKSRTTDLDEAFKRLNARIESALKTLR